MPIRNGRWKAVEPDIRPGLGAQAEQPGAPQEEERQQAEQLPGGNLFEYLSSPPCLHTPEGSHRQEQQRQPQLKREEHERRHRPAIVEAFMMEIFFEALREAGVRLPRPVGQAVSIVGALVIGQAAVQAGLVSAPKVIIVAATGIASFTIPRFSLGIAVRLLRFPLMILAGSLGLFGIPYLPLYSS